MKAVCFLLFLFCSLAAAEWPTADLEPMFTLTGPRQESIDSNMVLIAIPIGKSDTDLVNKLMIAFDDPRFRVMLFHYDNDIDVWTSYPWYYKTIRVSVKRQMKWWYFKRFMHPDVVAPYKYIFFLDSDLKLHAFNATLLVDTLLRYDVQLGQPSCCPEPGGFCSYFPHLTQAYPFTNNLTHNLNLRSISHYPGEERANIGRWIPNSMTESGPFVIMSKVAWRCVWNKVLRPDFTSGSGIDYDWNRICAQERTAVLDFMCISQENRKTASGTTDFQPQHEFNIITPLLQHIPPHNFSPEERVQPLTPPPQDYTMISGYRCHPRDVDLSGMRPILLRDSVTHL